MEETFEILTQYEKVHSWRFRFGSLFKLYMSKLWAVLVKDKKSWIFNILMLLPILAGPIIFFTIDYIPSEEFFGLYSDIMFMGYFGIIIPLFTMYIASMMFSDEVGDRTISYLTVRPINRLEIVLVKYLCYLCIIPIFSSIVTLLNYLSFGVFGYFEYFDVALWYLLAAFIASAVYGAFFMFVGLLFKNPLWFGLFFVFIWEFVLASFSRTLNNLTIAFYIKSLIVYDIFPNSPRSSPAIQDFFGGQASLFSIGSNPASAPIFSVVLVVIVIVSITLAWARMQGDRFGVPYQAGRRPGGWKYYLKEIRTYMITFSIILVTLGLVFAPVNGIKKNIADNFAGNRIDIEPYDVDDWYNPINPSNPDIDDMGWGIAYLYSFTQGDSLQLSFAVDQDVSIFSSLTGLICDEDSYRDFLQETQVIWLDWALEQTNYPYTADFTYSHQLYHSTAADFVENALDSVTLVTYSTRVINYNITETGKYYIIAFVDFYDLSYDEFDQRDITISVHGEIYRIGGYVLGYILIGFGLISMGFAGYSLGTYSSADEIKRYDEHTAKFNQTSNQEESIELKEPPSKEKKVKGQKKTKKE